MPHHLGRARVAPGEKAQDQENAGVRRKGCERGEMTLEQGEMNESCRCGDEQHGDDDQSRWPPGGRDRSAGQLCGATAEHDGDQDDMADGLAGVEPVHDQRFPPSR